MWWKVYCKGCKDEYVVRLNPDYDVEYTCMRLGCKSKLKKVKEVEPEIKERHDPWRNQNG